MKHYKIRRRDFISLSAAGAASMVIGCHSGSESQSHGADANLDASTSPDARSAFLDSEISPDADSADFDVDSSTNAAPTDAFLNEDGGSACQTTTPDITGPYWREGIPIRSDLDLYGDAGTRLILRGTVQDGTCTPIADAVLEMWHADPTIVAAQDLTDADTVGYDVSGDSYKYYGQFSTDSEGHYELITKKPGWYLNGSTFRPSHIHVKVYVAGTEKLTTQLYFQDDPFIAQDPWASTARDRIIVLESENETTLSGTMNFTLA